MKEVVAIVGASEKGERYANKAQEFLMEMGYTVVPVSPLGKDIFGRRWVSETE